MSDLQRIKPIFEQALDREGQDRRTYLDEVCGKEPELRRKVEVLLQAHEQAQGFLESPVLGEEVCPGESPLSEGPGTVIGRYKLLEKIGEGGMAVVYMAEQTEPIRRKVALKIIKLGMDTRQVIARFEAERQALALMDHPSIARVLDAGATETGRPYFVMELVQGVSITEYCDKNSLSTKDRLHLFLQVCHAVQHAHQKGIIHRDIKPSNVMVTHHDGKPVPKVIDFGIAKATDQKLTEKTLFTRYAHLIGTPAYMSPEQAELSDLDIDTRSDIYSLGVLLYELLTGTTPFSEEELRKAGYIEMQRVIREQEPVKPSTRIRTATRERRSPDRHSSDSQSGDWRSQGPAYQQVRGDLDWIVMKTLEKDRNRRYETASGLAEDVRRHLEHEPVLARGPSTTYRLRKFLRRHRVQVLIGLTVGLMTVVVAVVLSMWNRDRLQLAEADELREQALLSQAQGQYASGERDAALRTIQPILDSPHVGGKAQLLRAGILVDNRRPDEAVNILNGLLREPAEVAGAAHALLARILLERESLDDEKLKEAQEHRHQAETLLPETAEAYFLRAMMALTIKEQLGFLTKALQLEEHYESLRLRALTYYASRKYDQMKEDALGMIYLRRNDPLGHSLRAMALRELKRYEEAIERYDSAIALSQKQNLPYIDLAAQRLETLLRMGDYQRASADAGACLTIWPDKTVFRHCLFGALTALGDYGKARAVFEQIVASGQEARQPFRDWCATHVFGNLQAGRSWHPANHEPGGPAFLPMVEAEGTYRGLSAKGRRVITEGFSAQWSPNGKILAFSLGVQGRSGIALFDPATNETNLLIVPGKYPRWSPDGQYIAFVRDRQFLRVPEFVAADPKTQPRAPVDQEIWVMKSDGTEPRRIARGVWPSWGHDSTCVYYRSPVDRTLYSMAIEDKNATAKRITACPGVIPSVSPDNRSVAYIENASLKVIELTSPGVVAQWPLPAPSDGWGAAAWSPTGNELCLGGSGGLENRTGLWIYRLDQNEPAQILSGPITLGSWSPSGAKLVFELGAPCFEIWTADLPSGVSTIEALGPARTVEQHLWEQVAFHTHRIEADPLDAYAYCSRARCYDSLHERANADADMKRWSAVMSGKMPSAEWFGLPDDLHYVIGMPFNCELVFSAERPVNTIPVVSVAFGQKGRSEMKLFEIPMVVMSLLSFCCLSGPGTPTARANFTYGDPTNLGPAVNSTALEMVPRLSPDGRELYFLRTGNALAMVARRATPDDEWGPASPAGAPFRSSGGDGYGSMTPDGLTLYLDSDRPGGCGSPDLWMTTRPTADAPWDEPKNLGAVVNSASIDFGASVSADGLELYFTSNRPGGVGSEDIYVAKRATKDDPWGVPANLGPTVNSATDDSSPSISPDGLLLFFDSRRSGGYGSGYGMCDIYVARRATTKDAWGSPVNLGPIVNSSDVDWMVQVSADGSMLYFHSGRPGGFGQYDIWQVPIIRTVDFNGDGKVDAKDMGLLADNWGKNMSLCDIGPFAWGDGVVDEKDLGVLMESLVAPKPKAANVPCDAPLSWVSPSFANTCDVYLGTSRETVNTATRTNPQGVLVSQGQTVATYDPAEPLKLSQTYYWRVDFVVPGPAPTIIKGPVLQFTTAALTYPVKNVTAKASSAQAGSGPERTVDGSGLDKNDGHSTDPKDMWWSTGASLNWIQYEFDRVYTLHEMWVWNFNSILEPFMGFGAKTVKVEYSTDGTTWTPLANVPEFAKATGKAGYTANTIISFGGVPAKYVKLTIEKGWGSTPSAGLSEVRFFCIQNAAVPKP